MPKLVLSLENTQLFAARSAVDGAVCPTIANRLRRGAARGLLCICGVSECRAATSASTAVHVHQCGLQGCGLRQEVGGVRAQHLRRLE